MVACTAADVTAGNVPKVGGGNCASSTTPDLKYADNCAEKTAAVPSGVVFGGTILGYNKCYTTSGADEAPSGCQGQYLV